MNGIPDDLPPDLIDIGERLSASRPQADGHVLDRTMTRAQSASREDASSRMWSRRRPRARKTIVATIASVCVLFGAVGTASALTVDLGPLSAILGPISAGLNIPLVGTTITIDEGDPATQQYLGAPCLAALVDLANAQAAVIVNPITVALLQSAVVVQCGTLPSGP